MIISGTIIRDAQTQGVVQVVAYDVDFRSVQPLGRLSLGPSQSAYRIEYTSDRFSRFEKLQADVQVDALDERGSLLAQSDVIFNAPDVVEGLDLVLKLRGGEPAPEPTEYEQLLAAIEPITEGVSPAEFTDRDLEFLSEECQRRPSPLVTFEKLRLHGQLRFLSLAHRWEAATGIPAMIFYGGLRQNLPPELAEFLALPGQRIAAAVRAAVEAAIIPEDALAVLDAVLARRRTLRRKDASEAVRTALLRLLDAETGRPLGRATVAIEDLDGLDGPAALGRETASARGIVRLRYPWSAGARREERRRIRLTLLDAAGEAIVSVVLPLHPLQRGPVDVLLERPAPPVDAPQMARIFDRDAAPTLARLEITSTTALAREPRAGFVARAAGTVEPEAADALHYAGRAVSHAIHHVAVSNWIAARQPPQVDTPGTPTDLAVIAELQPLMARLIDCRCDDCGSALSPAAYLAQLLAWVLDHLRADDQPITLTQLQTQLHQRFGEIPSDCGAVKDEIRQARLAVVVLRGFTNLPPVEGDGGPVLVGAPPIGADAEGYAAGYRAYRIAAYRAILGAYGLSWEDLRDARLATDGPRREAVAARLGSDPAAVDDVFFDIAGTTTAISEGALAAVFGLADTRTPFAEAATPALLLLQRQRLASGWRSIDLPADDWGPEPIRPVIEPDVMTAAMIRDPPQTPAVLDLFEERRAALDAERASLVALDPGTVGPAPLVEQALGTDLAELRGLLAGLSDATAAPTALVSLQSLRLETDALGRLVDLDDRFDSAGQLDAEEVEDLLAILLRVRRRGLHDEWIGAESAAGVLFGSQDFVPRQPDAASPNGYLATRGEQDAWDRALAGRRRPSAIEPAVIGAGEIRHLPGPGQEEAVAEAVRDAAAAIHEARSEMRSARAAAFVAAREGEVDVAAQLDATLLESALGGGADLIDAMAAEEVSGRRISARLDAIDLAASGYRLIRRLQQRIADGLTPSAADWERLDGELLAMESRRSSASWREAEREQDVFLHPQLFRIGDDDGPETRAPADAARRSQVRQVLAARQRQDDGLAQALAHAVDAAEEASITMLRDTLVAAAPIDIGPMPERVEWLEGRLLIDLQMRGCAKTTRVAFAAETLARLVRWVHGGEAPSVLDHLSIDPEVFEAEFPALASYQTFRAMAFAYLYPEAALGDAAPPRMSPGFAALRFEGGSGMTRERACGLARDYTDYFADVSDLAVEATCQAFATPSGGDPCTSASRVPKLTCHMCARARRSGRIYVSRFRAEQNDTDTQDGWERVDGLGIADRIVGAFTHVTPEGRRLIVLLARTIEARRQVLTGIRYDLDLRNWSEPFELSLPPGAGDRFEAAGIQKRGPVGSTANVVPTLVVTGGNVPQSPAGEFPSAIAVLTGDGVVHLRALNGDATDWSPLGWLPLQGTDFPWRVEELLALVQRTGDSYVLFARSDVQDQVRYRVLFTSGATDDAGEWGFLGEGFRGAFPWPDSPHLYAFTGSQEATTVSLMTATNPVKRLKINSVKRLEEWLVAVAGVSLRRFRFEGFKPAFFNPATAPEGIFAFSSLTEGFGLDDAPLDFQGFSGSLYEALTLQPDDFEDYFGWSDDDNGTPLRFHGSIRVHAPAFLLAQFKLRVAAKLRSELKGIAAASFYDSEFGRWKLADLYLRRFTLATSDGEDDANDLLKAIEIVAELEARDHLGELTAAELTLQFPPVRTIDKFSRSIHWAFAIDEFDTHGVISSSPMTFVAGTFSDDLTFRHHRHAVYRADNGPFRIDFTRNDQLRLTAVTPYRVAPHHDGPLSLLPERGAKELQGRRVGVRDAYEKLSGAPPSTAMYLVEAYRLVPLRLARDLQEAGAYDEALAWYRLVFDYLAAPGERKIDHGLTLEEQLDFAFDDLDQWLGDTANVHAIAATRRGTWTRHAILAVAGCLIDEADALFSTDAPADLARATELYKRALDLLGHFGETFANCDQIIGRLEIDITDGIGLPVEDLRFALARIGSPERLNPLADELRAIARDPGLAPADRRRLARARLAAASRSEPPSPGIAARIETARDMVVRTETLALAAPTISEPIARLAGARIARRRGAIGEIVAMRSPRADEPAADWLRATPVPRDFGFTVERIAPGNTPLVDIAPMRSLTIAEPPPRPPSLNGLTIGFCVPQTPLVEILRGRAESSLEKLRACRNFAGFERALNPYGGAIGMGAGVDRDRVVAARVAAPNTTYRYAALRDRAMELVSEAEQVEIRYQASLVAAEEAEFRELQFRQQVKLTQARTRLADLRIDAGVEQVGFARLQLESAAFTARTYAGWIDAGANETELVMLGAYKDAEQAQLAANAARTTGAVLQSAANAAGAWQGNLREKLFNVPVAAAQTALYAGVAAAATAEGVFNARGIRAQTDIQQASFLASQERRADEWALQRGRAEFETRMAGRQIDIARSQLRITRQERQIAALEQSNAEDLLEYLVGMDFTAELHRWMAGVLGRIYRGFLQHATATARLAEAQLAWERQEMPPGLIKTDYWSVTPSAIQATVPEAASRLGLTGATRLKFDLQTLEQHAFDSRRRQDRFTWTLDLAQHAPIEFQRFRETGVLVFETPVEMLAREFPGHYLCLVHGVSLSVVALVPPTRGIRASLTSGGSTTVVVGGDVFSTVTLNAMPERATFTGTAETAGHVPLTAEDTTLRGVFDGIGFGGRWMLEMQRAVNPFDFPSIATVQVSFALSSRFSSDYQRQLLDRRNPRVEGEIAFGFRNHFPDAWYDLLNPDLTPEPMRVRFRTDTRSFPRHVGDARIASLVFYVVRADGVTAEIEGVELRYRPAGSSSWFGGSLSTIDGRASTRAASGIGLMPILGRPVAGEWALALPDDLDMENRPRTLLADERIVDFILVITFAGQEHPWKS